MKITRVGHRATRNPNRICGEIFQKGSTSKAKEIRG
jgi:hypothetical protein